MQDYSQNGEQAVILDFFGSHKGTFLDIGANDGVTLSNTRALALRQWTGILVEPAPAAFEKLQRHYLRIHPGEAAPRTDAMFRLINAAITLQDGPVDFWDCGVHLHKGDTSLLSTTRPETMERWKRSHEQFTKTTVRGITFRTLMEECGYAEKLPTLDFISIDCEGADWDALSQIDLTAVGCRMLCVEVNGGDDSRFTDYARQHGMRLHWQCFENRIYARA